MLILTRRLGEKVVVGDDVVISVLDIRGDAVRLGIQAPRSVTVHREEVYLELQRANQSAARSATGATDDEVAAVAAGAQEAARRAGPGSPVPPKSPSGPKSASGAVPAAGADLK